MTVASVARATPARAGQRIGRFEIERLLGQGAQATVWLAHDTRLDRAVALKLLNPDAEQMAVDQWMHEARAVSRLAHPNLVPVFEADQIDGQGVLVFEFVDGPTLAQQLRERGSHGAQLAVRLIDEVLDAVAAAHAAGIVHRDLKPSNVLVGKDGRARVMDFGIAARLPRAGRPAPTDGRIVGTPGYMSPEAGRGEAPQPAMDVFAAGMMLAELLHGQPLIRERDPWVAIRRTQEEDLLLPPQVQVDDTLRAIVQRAIERDPGSRYANAVAMRSALADWARPAALAVEAGGGGAGTLEFLLRRMKRKSDFPALSTAVGRIQRLVNSDRESLQGLAQEVLNDVALTHKLLRMVNSAHFAQAGTGGVTTISRAVALVGFAGIRNMALSIVLLDHLQDKQHAEVLKAEFLRALMAGQLAGEVIPLAREAEEAHISALLRNLGRLLTGFYFPEEAQQIREQVAHTDNADEELIAARVLGIGFEELGLGVARHWGLPGVLQQGMRKPSGEPPAKLIDQPIDRIRWAATVANEVAQAIVASDADVLPQRIGAIAERHARALGLSTAELKNAVVRSREKLAQMAAALQLDVSPQSPARRLLLASTPGTRSSPDALDSAPLAATVVERRTAELSRPGAPDEAATVVALPPQRARAEIAQQLSAGIQDITNSMVDDQFQLNELLRMVLRTMLGALDFQRVLLLLRDPRADMLVGRIGLGDRAMELAPLFKVPLKLAPGAVPDLFSAVCLKGADTFIRDATVESIAKKLPRWQREQVGARAFLLLPMALKGAPFGLIYADKVEPGSIELDDKELNLLKTLRNQVVMAFRQKG